MKFFEYNLKHLIDGHHCTDGLNFNEQSLFLS